MQASDPRTVETRYFRELDGDRTGLVHVHSSFVRRCDVSFGTGPRHPDSRPAYVMMDDGRVLSLHENEPVSAGAVNDDESRPRVGRAEVISHLALIGYEPWRAEEPVRRISFRCPDVEHLFAHDGKQRRIARADVPSDDDLRLFQVSVGQDVYGADHVVHVTGNALPRSDGILFWMEFAEGCLLDDTRQRLGWYLSFLSFMANRRVAPRSVWMGKAFARDVMWPEHEVVLSLPVLGPQTEPCPSWKAPFAAWDDEDLAALVDGLSCWIGRMDRWQEANVRMMICLETTEKVGDERMLDGWRWFERMPETAARRTLTSEAIAPLVDAALAAASETGLGYSRKDIKGALRRLCWEDFEQKIRRLAASAMRGTDTGGILGSMVKDIVAGQGIRNDAAHGNLSQSGQQAAIQRALSAAAVKAFCFLFTVRDLPLAPARRARLRHHPLVADYARLLAANREPLV